MRARPCITKVHNTSSACCCCPPPPLSSPPFLPRDLRALPFFIYAWLDQDIIVGRGRSGGVALWVRADTDWLAKAGVLTVYK